MAKTINKKNTITIITSIVLAFAIILTSVILYDWEEDPILIKALGTIATEVVLGTVMLVVLNLSLGVKDAFNCVKYNQYWIRHHSKDDIIARYGEFDYSQYRNGFDICYYKTGKNSSVSFDAIAIYFDGEGNVKKIDMNSSFTYPGG